MARNAAFALVLFVLIQVSHGQVLEGWHIISGSSFPPSLYGGGILMVNPKNVNQIVPVTGLSPELTGIGTNQVVGASCILYRESDGLLVVGEHAPSLATLDIHAVTLSGNAVATDTKYTIGTVNSGVNGNIDQMAWLSDTEVLFAHRNNTTGPMTGYNLGILNLVTGSITPVLPAGLQTGTNNALAVNHARTEAYIGRYSGPSGSQTGYVYKIPLPYTGTYSLLVSVPRAVLQLAADAAGNLFAGLGDNSPLVTSDLIRIDTTTGAVTPEPINIESVNALAIDPTTGNLCFFGWTPGTPFVGTYFGPSGGPFTPVVALSAGTVPFVDNADGYAVNANMDPYGTATPGLGSYSIDFAPNPGGLPVEGNLGFSLTVRSTLGTAPGVLGIALSSSTLAAGGIDVFIDPNTLLVLIDLPASAVTTIPLGIPAGLGLSGTQAYVQAAFVEANGLASSAAVRITIL